MSRPARGYGRPPRSRTRRRTAEYQRRLIAANALDFDDLIMTTVHLLQASQSCASNTGGDFGTFSWTSTKTPIMPSTR